MITDDELSILGAIPLAALGLILLARSRGRRDVLWLGAFVTLTSVSLLFVNFVSVWERDITSGPVDAFNIGVRLTSMFFLLAFVRAIRPTRGATALLAAYAGAVIVLSAVLVYAGASGSAILGRETYPLLLFGIYYAAFPPACLLLYLGYREAPLGTPRHRFRSLLIALLVFPTYVFAWLSVERSPELDRLQMMASLAFVLGIAAHAYFRPPPSQTRDPGFALAMAVPVLAGFLTPVSGFTYSGLSGIFRAAMAVLLTYAILRHRVFDLDLRLRRLAGPVAAGLVLAYGIVLGILDAAGGGAGGRVWAWPLGGFAVAAVLVGARQRIGDLAFPRRGSATDEARFRQVEIYRASLVAAERTGLPAEARELERMRKLLGISTAEHARLVADLQAAREPPELGAGRVVLGRYRLERTLGEGSFGVTMLAVDLQSGARVAVKLGGQGLAKDALAARVRHANVVSILDQGEDTRHVVVMEYVPGGTLEGLLARRRTLPDADARRLMDEVLAGLEACHAAGVVHGDLKPANVLLDAMGRAKLADFGSARSTDPMATLVAVAPGTLAYMAPEQVRGELATEASDAYAAAAILYEMLVGEHYVALPRMDDFALREAILRQPRALDRAPAWARPVLARALSIDPADRFHKAADLREALSKA